MRLTPIDRIQYCFFLVVVVPWWSNLVASLVVINKYNHCHTAIHTIHHPNQPPPPPPCLSTPRRNIVLRTTANDDDHSYNSNNHLSPPPPPTTTTTTTTPRLWIGQLLDTALVLRHRVSKQSKTLSSSSWVWMVDQLESMIQYLLMEYRSVVVQKHPEQQHHGSTISQPLVVVQQQLQSLQLLFDDVTTSTTTATPHDQMKNNDTASVTINDNANPVNPNIDVVTTSFDPSPLFDYYNDDDSNDAAAADDDDNTNTNMNLDDVVDVAIVGAGIGGLCAGAILNTVYHKKVAIYESHSIAGGCAHAFERTIIQNNNTNTTKTTLTFDSGPTILLGCSASPYNAIRQVLEVVQQNVSWIPYDGWMMIENPIKKTSRNDHPPSAAGVAKESSERRWRVTLGPHDFINGPLRTFGGIEAVQEYGMLQNVTKSLTIGASIPAMSMRSGSTTMVPLLLRHFSTLISLMQQGDTLTGTFAPYMDGPIHTVKSPWLRNWLDALAFSLSGLPASRTAAAAMAFVIHDMHREGATLDYPVGGMGEIVKALVRAVEQGPNGSKVYLRHHVKSIDGNQDATKITGITLRKNNKRVIARDGVICNAPIWSLRDLISDERIRKKLNMGLPLIHPQPKAPVAWSTTIEGSSINMVPAKKSISQPAGLLLQCESVEMTASFIHLHLALNATGLNLNDLAAHYTVMDRSLAGDGSIVNGIVDGPCSMGNMIAVSNPCVLDRTLAPDGYIVMHAYGAGNEPYEIWENIRRNTPEYIALKKKRAEPLWRAVESIIPDARERVVLELIGTPLTHERFLRRPRGTYGSVTEDYLRDGATAYNHFVLASDGIFPGIGIPAVAIAGASAANSLVSVWDHLRSVDSLHREGRLKI
jgi:phytoene dehydrogenase-like protein